MCGVCGMWWDWVGEMSLGECRCVDMYGVSAEWECGMCVLYCDRRRDGTRLVSSLNLNMNRRKAYDLTVA